MQSQKLFTATVRSLTLVFLTILLALSLCSPLPLGEGPGLALSKAEGVRAVLAATLTAISGTVWVCPSGCDYASLTLADGLFAAINAEGLSGDLVAEIRGDLTAETDANSLYQWPDDGGPWTLTIQPAGGVTRTVTGSGSDLIALRGADRVTLDGLNSGGNALLIRNTATGTAVCFANDGGDYAMHNTTRNCTVEGNGGVLVRVESASNNTIANNVIRNRSDVTGGMAGTLVRGLGSGSGNVIRDNTLMNFGVNGIYIYSSDYSSMNWTISGNTMFNEASFYAGSTLWGIRMNGGGGRTASPRTPFAACLPGAVFWPSHWSICATPWWWPATALCRPGKTASKPGHGTASRSTGRM